MIMIFIRRMATNTEIKTALKTVHENIQNSLVKRPQGHQNVRLVAVSKTKPVSDIVAAYECGQRYFGENYLNELEEKCKNPDILEKCKDIQWHFIGHCQTKKGKKLAAVPNLYMMETVHSAKLANLLNRTLKQLGKTEKLKVMVQINTSGEENKNGVAPSEAADLVKLILNECDCLEFVGLMTIGSFNHSLADGENPDFLKLIACREEVCAMLDLKIEDVELSMGMSNDYEHAIELGSTNVRVGSTIFGARAPPKEKQETVEQITQHAQKTDSQQTTDMPSSSDTKDAVENDEIVEQFRNVAVQH